MNFSAGEVFASEVVGTALLILLGAGVVANVILPKTKGFAGGTLMINFGWGLAVFTGVYASWKSGAHLNPAVTIGIMTNGQDTFVRGRPAGRTSATCSSTSPPR